MDIARSQTAKAGHVHLAKLVNRSWRNHDHHRDVAGNGTFRLAGRFHFHGIITAGFVISLQAPRNVINPMVGIRLRKQIDHLTA